MPDALAVDWLGRPCPKCGYVRTRQDAGPASQCPRCRLVYAQFKRGEAHASDDMAPYVLALSSLLLVAVNVIVLAIAWRLFAVPQIRRRATQRVVEGNPKWTLRPEQP